MCFIREVWSFRLWKFWVRNTRVRFKRRATTSTHRSQGKFCLWVRIQLQVVEAWARGDLIDHLERLLQATLLAMSTCVKKLRKERGGEAPDYILIDGNRIPDELSKEEAQFVIKVHVLLWQLHWFILPWNLFQLRTKHITGVSDVWNCLRSVHHFDVCREMRSAMSLQQPLSWRKSPVTVWWWIMTGKPQNCHLSSSEFIKCCFCNIGFSASLCYCITRSLFVSLFYVQTMSTLRRLGWLSWVVVTGGGQCMDSRLTRAMELQPT